MAKMRAKITKMKAKMAKMRPKMAKMKAKIAKPLKKHVFFDVVLGPPGVASRWGPPTGRRARAQGE